MSAQKPKPILILVPGAWHSPSGYTQLITNLESHGYNCLGISLPSVNPVDAHSLTVDTDVDDIRETLIKILASGTDALLICHSYSGIPAQAAASNLPNDTPGKLIGIAMIASFIMAPKQSLIGTFGRYPIHDLDESTQLLAVGPPGPKTLFYNDLPDHVADQHIATLKPHAWRSKTTEPTTESLGYLDGVPTSYLVCKNDQAIPLFLQKQMIDAADALMAEKDVKRSIRVEEVESGHSPFLSMVERTGDYIRRSAGEDVPM